MTQINPAITGVEALKLVRKMKNQIKEVEFQAKYGTEVTDISKVDLHNWLESLEKLEERLQWSV